MLSRRALSIVGILLAVPGAAHATSESCAYMIELMGEVGPAQDVLNREIDRVQAMKPEPKHDEAVCKAGFDLAWAAVRLKDALDRKCFPKPADYDAAQKGIKSILDLAQTAQGYYCVPPK